MLLTLKSVADLLSRTILGAGKTSANAFIISVTFNVADLRAGCLTAVGGGCLTAAAALG